MFRVLHTLDCDAWGGYGSFVSSNVSRLGAATAVSADKLAITIFAPYRYASTVYNFTTNDTGKPSLAKSLSCTCCCTHGSCFLHCHCPALAMGSSCFFAYFVLQLSACNLPAWSPRPACFSVLCKSTTSFPAPLASQVCDREHL